MQAFITFESTTAILHFIHNKLTIVRHTFFSEGLVMISLNAFFVPCIDHRKKEEILSFPDASLIFETLFPLLIYRNFIFSFILITKNLLFIPRVTDFFYVLEILLLHSAYEYFLPIDNLKFSLITSISLRDTNCD